MSQKGASSFEELKAWQLSRELVRDLYAVSREGDLSFDWGFRNQLSRAAISIMNNIAEGFARNSDREFARYLDIARGSVTEVKSMLYAALDIGYISQQQFQQLTQRTNRALSAISGLSRYLRQSLSQERKA
jgi:four helix bundle protein